MERPPPEECVKPGANPTGVGSAGCWRCGKDDGHPRAVIVTGPGGAVVGSGGGADSLCYKCGENGHRASECVKPGANPTGEGSADGCWRCGKDDHFSRNCPGKN